MCLHDKCHRKRGKCVARKGARCSMVVDGFPISVPYDNFCGWRKKLTGSCRAD
eukprot:gene36921-22643_t